MEFYHQDSHCGILPQRCAIGTLPACAILPPFSHFGRVTDAASDFANDHPMEFYHRDLRLGTVGSSNLSLEFSPRPEIDSRKKILSLARN
jgi:hypothetical protein